MNKYLLEEIKNPLLRGVAEIVPRIAERRGRHTKEIFFDENAHIANVLSLCAINENETYYAVDDNVIIELSKNSTAGEQLYQMVIYPLYIIAVKDDGDDGERWTIYRPSEEEIEWYHQL